MSRRALKIGVVGFSRNQFDQNRARDILNEEFRLLKEKLEGGRVVEIVSGYTNMGVPKLAYQLAENYEFTKVGFSAQQAFRVNAGLYHVDKEVVVGEQFGDESAAFVAYIDGLIRVGGGRQSRHEVKLFRALHADKPLSDILKEYEVEWYGT